MKEKKDLSAPKTIKELEKFYKDHNFPTYEETKIFIGEQYKSLKAYGVYKDSKSGKYVVFQNKGNGVKITYYEGYDEEFAVNKVYLRIKERLIDKDKKSLSKRFQNTYLFIYSTVIVMIIIFFVIYIVFDSFVFVPQRGYYFINNQAYYQINGFWYQYDNDDWHLCSEPKYFGSLNDYYKGKNYKKTRYYSDIRYSSIYNSKWDKK